MAAAMEDINSTETTTTTSVSPVPTSGNFIDTSHDDYFRLYDASLVDDGEEELTNLIVGIWNPQNNQTNTTSSLLLAMNDGENATNNAPNGMLLSTWSAATLLASAAPSALAPTKTINNTSAALIFSYPSTSTTTTTTTATSSANTDFELTAAASLNSTDAIEGLISLSPNTDNDTLALNITTGFAQILTSTSSSSSSSSSASLTSFSSAVSAVSNYGEDVDIALIDSAETGLAGDTDYEPVGFDGGSLGTNDLINQSLQDINPNETFHHFGNGNIMLRSSGIDGNGNGNDEDDGGSSFMLLLEDFGEYFYNYNGSNMVSGTTTTATTNIFNFTNFDYRTNCTNYGNLTTNLTSSLCYEGPTEGE